MELEKGFKQTEVGVIPNDWEVRKLGSILKVVGGGAFRSIDSSSTGVKWLKISNVGINKAIWDDESYLPIELIKSNENFLLKENDYVLALTRPILDRKLKITRLKKDDVPALLNQRVGKIETAKSNSIEFAYYLFQKFETINALIQSMAGTDPPNLGNWGIYNVNCAIPPTLQEQTAISTALSDTDTLITSLEKLIAKKRNIKQGAMQELLKPKKGWEVKRLGEIADIIDPHPSHRAPKEQLNGIPFIGIGDVNEQGKLNYDKCRKVSEDIFDEHSRRYNLSEKLLAVGRVASIGKVVRIQGGIGKYTISPTLAVIKPREIDIDFLYYLLSSTNVQNQFDKIKNGSTRNSVGMIVFRDLDIDFPDQTEQLSIGKVLNDMNAEIIGLESKLEKYKEIKSGIMQNLLTGKIRLV
jgi:type I restriction enzyme S subunit